MAHLMSDEEASPVLASSSGAVGDAVAAELAAMSFRDPDAPPFISALLPERWEPPTTADMRWMRETSSKGSICKALDSSVRVCGIAARARATTTATATATGGGDCEEFAVVSGRRREEESCAQPSSSSSSLSSGEAVGGGDRRREGKGEEGGCETSGISAAPRAAADAAAAASAPAAYPAVLVMYPLRVPDLSRPHAPTRKWREWAEHGFQPQPFPNLLWLVDPVAMAKVGHLEHLGYVKRFQKRLDDDEELMAIHYECNARRGRLCPRGYREILRDTGVGGMRHFNQVKCLHVHYAHYLACGGEVGGSEGSLVGGWTAEAMRQVCAHVTQPPNSFRHGRTAANAARGAKSSASASASASASGSANASASARARAAAAAAGGGKAASEAVGGAVGAGAGISMPPPPANVSEYLAAMEAANARAAAAQYGGKGGNVNEGDEGEDNNGEEGPSLDWD